MIIKFEFNIKILKLKSAKTSVTELTYFELGWVTEKLPSSRIYLKK